VDYQNQEHHYLVPKTQNKKKQKTNNSVSKLEESSSEQAETILMINKELPKLATKKDIFIIAKELKQHSNRLDSCALASTLEELEEKVIRISQTLEETQLLLGEAGKDIEVIQKILPSKASSNEMQKRVLTEKFEAYQKMLSESMNTKASASTAEALQTSLQVFPFGYPFAFFFNFLDSLILLPSRRLYFLVCRRAAVEGSYPNRSNGQICGMVYKSW
jgi:uncharacterized coiled-coil protein SlyX